MTIVRVPMHAVHALIGIFDLVDETRRSVQTSVGGGVRSIVERGRKRANGVNNIARRASGEM